MISAVPLRFAFKVAAFVDCTVLKLFEALALFVILKPLAFIDSAVGVDHDAFAGAL